MSDESGSSLEELDGMEGSNEEGNWRNNNIWSDLLAILTDLLKMQSNHSSKAKPECFYKLL